MFANRTNGHCSLSFFPSHLSASLLCGILSLCLSPTAFCESRNAKLIIKGDITCHHQSGTDHMLSTDQVPLTLPDVDGRLSFDGHYDMTGSMSPAAGMNGYQLAGRSVYKGVLKDETLSLDFGQWHYAGRALNNSSSAMPSPQHPVNLTLEPGESATVKFNENQHGVPCNGRVVYRLEIEPETQIWDLTVNGERKLTHLESTFVIDEKTGKRRNLDYNLGVLFTYQLAARFTLTKKNKAWTYTNGTIGQSHVDYQYFQDKPLYKVNKISCSNCQQVTALKGKSLSGVVSDGSVKLMWPNIQPVVTVRAQLNTQCAPGELQAACLRLKEESTTSMERTDEDFFDRASGHDIPLKNGPYNPPVIDGKHSTHLLHVVYHYNLKRVK